MFVSQHRLRGWKLLAVFTVITMLMSMVVQTGLGQGLPEAGAGTTPPIVIDGDPCGAGDWQNPDVGTVVVVNNDMNSTATSETVDAGYDCDNLITVQCDNNAADDIFLQSESTSKFNATSMPMGTSGCAWVRRLSAITVLDRSGSSSIR
jgi:hypothetical protein